MPPSLVAAVYDRRRIIQGLYRYPEFVVNLKPQNKLRGISEVAVDRRATVLGDFRDQKKTPSLREGYRRPTVNGYLKSRSKLREI